MYPCSSVGVTRSAPIIQEIENKTVVEGNMLNVICQAAAHEVPEFNLMYIFNGSEVPVKIGGHIKMELVNKTKVCSKLVTNALVTELSQRRSTTVAGHFLSHG
jgi:hypothetical protein